LLKFVRHGERILPVDLGQPCTSQTVLGSSLPNRQEDAVIAEAATKLTVKTDEKKDVPQAASAREWRPFDALRREIDRLFDDFNGGFWRSPFRRSAFDLEPFWRREQSWAAAPAMDVAETDKAYEITAELPGMNESDVQVVASSVANGWLRIEAQPTGRGHWGGAPWRQSSFTIEASMSHRPPGPGAFDSIVSPASLCFCCSCARRRSSSFTTASSFDSWYHRDNASVAGTAASARLSIRK
jgi:hypothetical protein